MHSHQGSKCLVSNLTVMCLIQLVLDLKSLQSPNLLYYWVLHLKGKRNFRNRIKGFCAIVDQTLVPLFEIPST